MPAITRLVSGGDEALEGEGTATGMWEAWGGPLAGEEVGAATGVDRTAHGGCTAAQPQGPRAALAPLVRCAMCALWLVVVRQCHLCHAPGSSINKYYNYSNQYE